MKKTNLMIGCSLLSFGALMSSEKNQKVWCDDKDDRNSRVEQWVASQAAINRIKVLEQQIKVRSVPAAKKETKFQR